MTRPYIVVQGPVATRSGYGNHTRDFTYIDDVTNIMVRLINKKITKHQIFNICSSKPIHLKKVINKLNQYLEKTKVVKKPLQKADIKKTHGSNKKYLNNIELKGRLWNLIILSYF